MAAEYYGSGGDKEKDTSKDIADPGGFWHKNQNKAVDQPPQPDYLGAARIQAGGSIGTALANALMGQNDVNSPLGSQTWNQSGTTSLNIPGLGNVNIPRFQQNINLSPEQQSLYQGQTGLQQNLLGQAGTNLGQPIGNDANDIANKAYGAFTSRLDPQWSQREDAQRTQLANQGISSGSEAYTNAMRDFNAARNDAYQQANLGAIQTMPQTYQIQQGLRDLPLNELMALRSGTPVSMPQFSSGLPGSAQGPQTLSATGQQSAWEQAMYNQQVQAANQQRAGLMGLGSAAMMAFL